MDVWYATTLWLALISGWIDPTSGRRTRYNPYGSIIVRPVVPPSILVPPSAKRPYYYKPIGPTHPIVHQTDFAESSPRMWRSVGEPWNAEKSPYHVGHQLVRSAPRFGYNAIFGEQNRLPPSFQARNTRSSYDTMPIFNMEGFGSQNNPFTMSSMDSHNNANPYVRDKAGNSDFSYAPLARDSAGTRNEFLDIGQVPALRLLPTGEQGSNQAQMSSNPPQDELEDIWKDFYGSRLKPNVVKSANALSRSDDFVDRRPSSAYELLTADRQQDTGFQSQNENRLNTYYSMQDSRFDPNKESGSTYSGRHAMTESEMANPIAKDFKLGPPISPETIQGQVADDEYSQRKIDYAEGSTGFAAARPMQRESPTPQLSSNRILGGYDGSLRTSQQFPQNDYSRDNINLRDFNEGRRSSYDSSRWPNQMQTVERTAGNYDFPGQHMRRYGRSNNDFHPNQYPDDIKEEFQQ